MFCDSPNPSVDAYLKAYCRISQAIDYMRIVYANVGETERLIGLYPYEPLHDMRKAIERIDPRLSTSADPSERAAAQEAIWDAFYALREEFLEEFDLNQPTRPIVQPGSRRKKRSGAARRTQGSGEPAVTATSVQPPET